MSLKNVFGFYYRIGSVDFPFNMDPNENFGFDVAGESAVFSYSINDVEKALTTSRMISKRSNYDSYTADTTDTGGMNVLIADASSAYADIKAEDTGVGTAWDELFRIIEYLANNQSSVIDNPTDSSYSSAGDEMLSSETLPTTGGTNPFYVSTYKKGTFAYQQSSHSNRLKWVSFTCSGFESGNVVFTVYLDADAFVERSDNITYAVYRYEDLAPTDDTISPTEFDSQIIAKIFALTKTGKYDTYSKMFIDKRVSDTEIVQEQFFVFSSINSTITDEIMRTQIKAYLRKLYDDTTLRYTYPSLFDENTVRIIPLYDNLLETVGSSTVTIHALNISDLATILTNFGYNVSTSHNDYRPCEIFHIGPGAGWSGGSEGSSFKYPFPLLAIEADTDSGIVQPISKRFPSYKPIYGTNETGDAAEFHFILLTIIGYLMGYNLSLESTFVSEYEVIEYAASTTTLNRKTIQFKFSGDLWVVYGPTT